MTDDLLAGVHDTHRELTSSDAAPGARSMVLRRTYPYPVGDVWDACTSAERIAGWLGDVDGDLRLGGRYALRNNASGTVTECDAPHRLELTWEFGGETSWVRLELSADGDGTLFELTHTAVPPAEFWDVYGPGAVGVGWDLGLVGLQLHLAGQPKPDEDAWIATPEGISIVTAATGSWADAQVAAGDDRAVADRAATASRNFYLGITA